MEYGFADLWRRVVTGIETYYCSTMSLLRMISSDVDTIAREVHVLMATVQELNQKLDVLSNTITAERAEVVAGLQVLKDEIQALKDQVGGGGPATQADLDLIAARVDEQMNRVKGIITDADAS